MTKVMVMMMIAMMMTILAKMRRRLFHFVTGHLLTDLS